MIITAMRGYRLGLNDMEKKKNLIAIILTDIAIAI